VSLNSASRAVIVHAQLHWNKSFGSGNIAFQRKESDCRRPWLSGECGRPMARGLAVQSPLKKKIGGLTAGGVAVHLLVTAEGAVIGCPPLQYECVTLCMRICVCSTGCTPGWVKCGGQISCMVHV